MSPWRQLQTELRIQLSASLNAESDVKSNKINLTFSIILKDLQLVIDALHVPDRFRTIVECDKHASPKKIC